MINPWVVRAVLLTLLALISGCVDAVSYLGLGHVFTANMTGNTVLLGLAFGGASGLSVARSATALFGFIAGAAVGAAVAGRDRGRAVWPPVVTATLALEFAALIALAAGVSAGGATPSAGAESALSPSPHWRWASRVRRYADSA